MLQSFKRHSSVCGELKIGNKKSAVKILNKDEKLKYKRTPTEYAIMENESKALTDDNMCFCCEEPLEIAHVIFFLFLNNTCCIVSKK